MYGSRRRAAALGIALAGLATTLPGFAATAAAQDAEGRAAGPADPVAADTTDADGRTWLEAAHDWRAEGEPDSALAALRRAAASGGVPSGLLSLEVARTAFLAGYPPDGLEAYRDGCEQADEETLDEYWRDFAAVATTGEQAAWGEAVALDGEERSGAACEVLEAGWSRRAARAGLGVAERLSLHYERLRHARERYSLVREGGTRLGPRTRLLADQVGRPEGAGLDDRGLVYVRLGEPDRVSSFGGSGAVTRKIPSALPALSSSIIAAIKDLQISSECYHPNESWAYDFPDGTRTHHFSPLEGTADWWLLENLHHVYRCGDPSSAVFVGPGEPPMTAVLSPATGGRYAPPAQIAWLVMTDLYMSRSALDPEYGAVAQRILTSGPSGESEMEGLRSLSLQVNDVLSEFSAERGRALEAARGVLTEIADRPAVTTDAEFVYEILQFRAGPAAERTSVWLNAVSEAGRLRAAPVASGGVRYDVRATISLAGEDGELYQREAMYSLSAPGELEQGAGIPARLSVDAPPGRYVVTVVLRDANDESERPVGNWTTRDLTVRSYRPNVPLLSDVAVAPDSGGTTQLAPGIALPISPVHETDAEGRAWLYFEAYGLSPRGEYEIEVRLEPRDDGEPFTLSYRGAPPATAGMAVRRLLRLELDDSPPGEYTLRLTVTDAAGDASLPLETPLQVRR